jgi:GNAT superfamily N-acetyltransferase
MTIQARQAGPADIDAIVETVTAAFFDDPLWGPPFVDRLQRAAQASQLWRLFVASPGLRYPWTFVTGEVTGDADAAAVWVPPGGHELTEEEDAGYDEFLVGFAGRAAADEIQAIGEAFENAHPAEPHFYLSLLATNPAARGRGLGMDLVRDGLARIDALGMPAYLESSNPAANDARYRSVGFEPIDELVMPSGHRVTTMWRASR